MADIIDRHNPSFSLWPVNNNRTAWRSFGLPVVLVVPHMRDAAGRSINDSAVSSVSISIEGAPTEAIVAGHDHVGLRFPDRELYRRNLTTTELLDRKINTDLLDFETADGIAIDDRADVKTGDIMSYTTTSGVTDKIEFLADADYYDLSDILIETENLPANRYNLIYSCTFNLRVVATEQALDIDELICIDINKSGQGTLRFGLNHPGEVMLEMHNFTPPVYLTNAAKSADSTIAFYRPFTDILQDIYDEQQFIKTMNWVHSVPYEAIPYLSQLLGWDVPYFPESLDQLRRLILRKTRELQQLKGSRRAVRELMALFGFTILFKNIWYAIDGSRFIAPAEHLPPQYANQEIRYEERFQVEPLLSAYDQDGFGGLTINLLFRPQRLGGQDPFRAPEDSSDLTIDAYLVTIDSDAHTALRDQVELMYNDPEDYGESALCVEDDLGFINVGRIQNALTNLQIVGHSQILVRGGFGVDQAVAGLEPPFRIVGPPLLAGVSFNKVDNVVNLIFDHHISFSGDNTVLYVFASYKRQEVIIPTQLADLRSNRFSIQILTRDGNDVRPDVLEFVLDFIYKIKAFHSLLHSIQYRSESTESYLVSDLCVGGDVTQRYDTAIGRQQVPPAIIPAAPGEDCSGLTAEGLGYKQADLIYRRLVLAAVIEEFTAWKALDDRTSAINSLLRVLAALPDPDRGNCKYTPRGQDRVIGDTETVTDIENNPPLTASQNSNYDILSPLSQHTSTTSTNSNSQAYSSSNVEKDRSRQPWCDIDARTDYCYKGRVNDHLLLRLSPALTDRYKQRQCTLGLGHGIYWLYPSSSKRHIAGVKISTSRSRQSAYSGGATEVGQQPLLDSVLATNLEADPSKPLSRSADNFLGYLLRSYSKPISESIHFSDRFYLDEAQQSRWLALQRPSLEIEQPIMHFPGCRFPTMGNLMSDYHSDDWTARPWDDVYSSDNPCCNGAPSWLNATVVDNSLIFDSAPFTIRGNGLEPDITSLGTHSIPASYESSDIVHDIYSSLAAGHPAIEIDNLIDCGTPGDVINISTPRFPSAVETADGNWQDYCDGYPATTGYFEFSDLDIGRDGIYQELFEALAVPGIDFSGSAPATLLYYLSSGISTGTIANRLDCGCQLAVSETAVDGLRLSCATNLFLDDDDNYDFDGDLLSIDRILIAEEAMAAGPYMLDGTINNLMPLIT